MNRRLGFDNASIGSLWLCYALSFCLVLIWFWLGFEWCCHSARDGFGMALVMFRYDLLKFCDGCVMAFLSALVLEWLCHSARGGFCLALVRSCYDV